MGKLFAKKTERDQMLIADYIKSAGTKNGKRVYKYQSSDLVGKYNISTARLYQILGKYGVPKRIKN